jgi:cytochrome c7-like protein
MPIVTLALRIGPPITLLALLVSLSSCAKEPRAMIAAEKSPEQPIAFMHDVHFEQNQIPCAYCHYSAAYSEEAGIPAVGTCMGCHRFVRGTSQEFQTEIGKLMGFAADSVAIPWVRVHSLPDFVQFTHRPHIRAGLDCTICHGDIAGMARVERVAPLTMGWCLGCHRDRGAPDDCATCHF